MTITGVTVASPPVVTFKATDQNGTPVSGLLPANLRFTIAKLIPGTPANGNLSNWQNYVVRVSSGRVQGNRETPTAANFKDNGDGTYTYTFQTDITNVTCPATPCNDSYGNPLDLSYDPTLTHRVGMQIARGSTTLPLSNATYTFRPSDGATTGITQRDIVKTARCNECHGTLQAHDQRIETKYCVTCHNRGTTANGKTGTQPSGDTPVDFRVLIHKLHNAPELPSVLGPDKILNTADDGDYGIIGFSGTLTSFKDVEFPQNNTNCVKCHGNGTDPETPQGDNWKNRPNMYACGACHDNVYFGATTTNTDQTVAHKDFTVVGVAVGPLTDNSQCATCHTPTEIATLHVPVVITSVDPAPKAATAAYQDNLPAGASKMTYEIKANGVTVSGTPKRATVVFRILRDGVAQTFNAFGAGVKLINDFGLEGGAPSTPSSPLNSGPSFYLAYAVPQDNNTSTPITAPSDFNVSANVSLLNVWNGTQGTLSGPDGSGYYTAVLGGGSSTYLNMDIPASAVMVTAGFGFGALVQMTVPGYPGGLTLITPVTQQVAAGYTARRVIAAKEKCNACHATLGTDPTFHGGNRNDPTVCNFCHYAARTSHGWSGRSDSFIHAIHGAGKRTVNFTWHGTQAAAPVLIDTGFWQILFPGILNKCETCHVPGAYDFSGTAYTDTLMSSLPYTIVATGTMSSTDFTRSPYVDSAGTVNYGANFSYTPSTGVTVEAADTTLATSPIATACFSCHDSGIARAHMESNGGSIYQLRSTALTKTETCLVCHGPGKIAAIAAMHAK
jgi:OmcA/MtrC family decaheme c-type cytochrome